ncbi:MAG: YeiH family protein [Rhizobiaceae bacterium]
MRTKLIEKSLAASHCAVDGGNSRFLLAASHLAPGLALTIGIACLGTAFQHLSGLAALSPLVVSMVLGMAFRNTVGPVEAIRPGVAFSLKRILRIGVILLGFQLTLTQIVSVGGRGIVSIVVILVATFVFTKWIGKLLGVDRKLAELIAAGTSVCGASAVIATNTVTRARDEDVAYAIGCVTVFGSISMLLAPLIGTGIGMDADAYGFWVGASIHEVAQVVAAAFQGGDAAGQTGTIVKLGRVILLAPLILVLGLIAMQTRADRTNAGKAPVPWFVFGFLAVIVLNSFFALPPELHGAVAAITGFLLAVALSAMGLETDIRQLRVKGLRPLALGALASVQISALSLVLVLL